MYAAININIKLWDHICRTNSSTSTHVPIAITFTELDVGKTSHRANEQERGPEYSSPNTCTQTYQLQYIYSRTINIICEILRQFYQNRLFEIQARLTPTRMLLACVEASRMTCGTADRLRFLTSASLADPECF